MSGHNGNMSPPGGEDREDLIRRLLDAEAATGTQTIEHYDAEEVDLPPPWMRHVLGPCALRIGHGSGRIYPRAEWLWRWVMLASVLAIGWWAVSESRASRHASERSEAWQQYSANKLKELTDARDSMRKRGGEDRDD